MSFTKILLSIIPLVNAELALAQSIETEFRETAPQEWLELRKMAFNESAIAVETYSKSSRQDDKTREINTRYTQFADGDFKYYESIPLSDSNPQNKVPFNRIHVTVHNAENAFSVYKDPDEKWKLRAVQQAPDSYEFNRDTLQAGWYSKQSDKGPLTTLSSNFAQDPRMLVSQTGAIETLVEGYLAEDEFSFHDFDVRDDPVFGRIVSAALKLDYDLRNRRRPNARPADAVKMQVRGKISFLADWHWVPVHGTTTYRELDKDGNVLKVSNRTVHVDYDPDQLDPQTVQAQGKPKQLIATRVTMRFQSAPDNRSSENVFSIRPLAESEIAAIRKSKKLSDFGLKTPK